MRRMLHALALLLGLTLLAAEPASAAPHQGQKVASGFAAVAELVASGSEPLSAERAGENPALHYDLASDSPVAARGLRAADFGAKATFKALEGTIKFEGKVATVSVRNMEGNLGNAWDALNALKDTARAGGATSLRIEGTIANPALLRAMERVLGPATRGAPGGAQDIWTLGL